MRYDVERAAVVLSVRQLCEYAFCSGDLDLRPGMSKRFSFGRAALGAAIHRRLQSEAGVLYTAEVAFSHAERFDNLIFEVSGRADGILATDPPTVDEIKTVSRRAFDLPPSPLHDAQVRCYAYFLCCEKGISRVRTRLTYVRTEDEEIRYLYAEHTVDELREFYHALLTRVSYRAQILYERAVTLLPSVHSGRFPYSSVREGQDILLKECYRDIRASKRLFAEAPTGIGKTVSTLYPAVRALGEGYCDKIFYLTAKASTRREAYNTAAKIFEAGSLLRTVVLTAREQICPNALAKCDPAGVARHCNPLDCPRAKGFYDRLPSALCDLLGRQSGYSRQTVAACADQYHICPYEFSLELSELCDIVICDYNYVFDPQVYLRRYFSPDANANERYVFLVDEAHNLCDRARGMFSAELKKSRVESVMSLFDAEDPLRVTLEKLAVTMHGFRRLCRDSLQTDEAGVERGFYLNRAAISSFHELVHQTLHTAEAWLRAHGGQENEIPVYLLCAELKRFDMIAERFDDGYLTFIESEGDERRFRLICLDPSRELNARMMLARSSILFSATMTPPDYFSDILGGGKNAVRISLPSPFERSHFCPVAVTGISTRFEDREKSYKKLVTVIAASVIAKKGNYIVYFPSYDYMQRVYELFVKKYPSVATVVQTRGMSGAEKDSFLDAFVDDGSMRIGFCVLGGSFSEGVDLPGGRLIGTVIVGTGLPGLSNERNILKEYYDVTRERGYDYAYVYPGMNRVLQAAGRVIRRDEDRGVVVLVDDRYADARMQMLFPDHWQHMQYARNASELAEIVAEFWKTST